MRIPKNFISILSLLFFLCLAGTASADDNITFTTTGSSFHPIITVTGTPTIEWNFDSDGNITTSNVASPYVDYGTNESRNCTLKVTPWDSVTKINIGYNGGDGNASSDIYPPLDMLPPQYVSKIYGLDNVKDSLIVFGADNNDVGLGAENTIDSLNFDGFTKLAVVECFFLSTNKNTSLKNTQNVTRLCFEENGLRYLDLTDCQNLDDFRGGFQQDVDSVCYIFGGSSYPKLWHFCVRDNKHICNNIPWQKFPALEQPWIWGCTNLTGLFNPSSTVLTYMTANGAQFENANLYGVLPRQILGGNINLADNNLSAVNAFGNPGMYGLKVNNNSLNQTEIDNILCALDMQNSIGGHLELQENTYPSRTGMIYINNLTSRGWTITYDQPPNIPADPNTTSPVAHWKSDNLDSTHNIIAFTSMSTNATSWQWSFGDGSPNSTLENPTHIYSNGLVHTVSLTVSNDAGSSTYTENVMKADPGVTWGNPANITYRIPLNRKQLNAAASVPGTFVYSPAPGTKLGIGSHTIYTTFTPTDYDNYYSVNLSKSINVTSGNIANYTANYTFSQENITGNTNLGVYLDPCFINSLTLNITNPFIDISTVNFGDYQKIITVDHTKVNTSLTDFPVLIAINNDTNLGSHALANGYDVKFKDSNGAYLNFEREYFEISDGECNAVFWVRIPVLSNITDTNITMIYGNVSATDSQNITGTWDTHFTGVYHLNQVPSETATQINDSTGNAVNGVANDLLPSNSANGKIGKGLVLATDDYITLTNEFMAGATSGTFSVWINPNTISGTDSEVRRCIIGKASNPDNGFGFSPTTNHIRGRIGPSTNVDGSTGINTGDWTFATLTWSSNDVNVYVNGSLDATGSGINVRWFNEPATYPTIIGRIYSGSASSAYDGYVDELQASNVSRSAGWIQTEYNNQYSPDNFYTISAEEMGSENSTYISLNPQTVNGKKVVIPGDYPWDVGYTFKTATNSSTVSYNNTTSGMLSTPYGVNDNAFSSFVTGKRETVNINGTVLPNGGLMYSPVLNINYTEPTDQVNETITDKSYVLNVSLSPDKNFSVMGNIVLTPSEDIQSIASNGKYTLVSNDVNATAQYDNNKNIIITTGALTSGTVYNYNLSIIKNSLQSQISKYVNAFLNFLLNHRLHVTEAIWQTL